MVRLRFHVGFLILAITAFFLPKFSNSQTLPTGSKGTLSLSVNVADELGYDTVSQVVELKNIHASEIEPFIQARLSRWGAVQVNDALNMVIITDKRGKLNDLVALVHQLDSPKLKDFVRLETVSIALNYTDPNNVKSLITPQLSQEGSMIVDSSHNALVITDLSSKINTIKRMLEKIDVFVPQVVIEAGIVEISDDYMSKFGIDWNALRLVTGTDSASSFGVTNPYTKITSAQNSWNLSGNLDLNRFFDLVNLLANENKANILTKTRIVTANNQTGVISAGQKVYYRPVGGSAPPSESLAVGGLGVTIVPQIGEQNVITLAINANLDDLTGWSQAGNPIFENRAAQSKVTLKDGETFVLGGLEKTTEVDNDSGIPILKDILPFIFSQKTKTKVTREVIVLLTPHIKRETGYVAEKDAPKVEEYQKGKVPSGDKEERKEK